MKLYATTTSERASKGQGGRYLDIQLQGEDKQELGVISARYDEHNKEYYLNYWSRGKCIQINRIKETKGNKQKGECTHNGQYIYNSIEGKKCQLCDN